MHLHLDPVGGIAGDMFAAALLDLFPDWGPELDAALARAGLHEHARFELVECRDAVLAGRRFVVSRAAEAGHAHRPHREVRALLERADLDPAVRTRALAMFAALAQAEARVHGGAADDVELHEVGAWDSILDVTAAAWLVERAGGATWSCAPLPAGSGTVASAHGTLPVPAPATLLLLEGAPLHDDGIPGERVTPTGAAILHHLRPDFSGRRGAMRLRAVGHGFGARALDGGATSNVLRAIAYEPGPADLVHEPIAVCRFEVDDQSPEDLAVALDRIRATPGVLDVTQTAALGKKGRMAASVRVLADAGAIDDAVRACLVETASLGVRWHVESRARLARDVREVGDGAGALRVKTARRPDGRASAKAEMDDLAAAGDAGGHAAREARRRRVEAAALDAAGEDGDDG